MYDSQIIGDRLFSNLSVTARVLVAVIILAILMHILQGLIYFLLAAINLFVIWPVCILISLLRIHLKILKFIILVLIWTISSLALGIGAIVNLFGLCWSRQTRAKMGSDGGGEGQEASLTSVQENGMAVRSRQKWQVHVLVSDRLDRGGHNVGVIVGDREGAGAWQATTLGSDGLVARGESGSALDHRSWRRNSHAE